MKTFSRLSLFMLVCFGFALMFGGSTADVHAQVFSLEVAGETGQDVQYKVGDEVTASFVAKSGTSPVQGVALVIDSVGVGSITLGSDDGLTNAFGTLKVTGMLELEEGAYISARWVEKEQFARADFNGEPTPTVIVVNAPDTSPLIVGQSFNQTIHIEGVEDLYAWQLSVVYNKAVLKPTGIAQGTFLPADASFAHDLTTADGEITVSQTHLGPTVGKNGKGTLLTLTFTVMEIADEPLGVHNVLLLNSLGQRIGYSISVKGPAIVRDSFADEDVDRDRDVDIIDLMLVASKIGQPSTGREDVNGDGFVNIIDLVMVAAKISAPASAAAPFASGVESQHLNPRTIQGWIDLAQVEDDGSVIFDQGIANLEALMASRIPTETRLLLNYPNPFNPETWIPYQLAKSTDVTVTIHSMNGSLIRTLELGHQMAGIYKTKSQAAYWNGRNEFGEHVASGLYFYTLTAGKFNATGKMLIRK